MLELISRYPTFLVFLAGMISLALSLAIAPLWIKLLRNKGIGQLIREDGPSEHQSKQGTPTMGGLLILLTALAAYLVLAKPWENIYKHPSLMVLFAVISCSMLGLFDDWSKIRNSRSLGIRARSKLFFEFLISIAVTWIGINIYGISTIVHFPFINLNIDFGYLYYLFVFIVIASSTNAVNLTDGLDGLAAGTVMIVMAAFMAIAFRLGYLDLALLAGAIGGGCLGLLWFNGYPASIFMGDTGSLGLGAALATLAIATKTELLLIVIGGIFVIESLSVILQVLSYRLTGKRILKMAPIHHHFELMGWSETIIMLRFWIVSAVFASIGFGLFFVLW